MKLCKDCKWVDIPAGGQTKSDIWKCKSPNNHNGINPVSGEYIVMYIYCDSQRKYEMGCENSGKWFEPKC